MTCSAQEGEPRNATDAAAPSGVSTIHATAPSKGPPGSFDPANSDAGCPKALVTGVSREVKPSAFHGDDDVCAEWNLDRGDAWLGYEGVAH
jgi:hypothetical protein